jgi:hypothetical protein
MRSQPKQCSIRIYLGGNLLTSKVRVLGDSPLSCFPCGLPDVQGRRQLKPEAPWQKPTSDPFLEDIGGVMGRSLVLVSNF